MSSPLLTSKTDRRDGGLPDALPSSPTGVRFGSAVTGGGAAGGSELATSPPSSSSGSLASPPQTHEPRASSRSGTSSGAGSSKRTKDKEATAAASASTFSSSISNNGVVLTIGHNGPLGPAANANANATTTSNPTPSSVFTAATSGTSTTASATYAAVAGATTATSLGTSLATSTTSSSSSSSGALLANTTQSTSSSSLSASGGFAGAGGGGGGSVGTASAGGTRRKTHKKQRSKERLEVLEMPEDRLIRSKLVQELLTSEEAHVQSLDILVRDYCEPLRSADILSPTVVQDMFCNLELIRNWHAAFLDRFKAHLQCGDTFGEVFLDMIPLLRQLYTQYNENYDHAMDTYEKAKKNKQFAAFLERKQREINENKDLLTYLYLPIQRMIAYDSLLKDILSRTPPTHRDFTHLSDALQSLRDIQFNASLRAKQRKNIDKVIHIQNRIAGTTQLALPHRRYVYEGRVLFIQPDGESSKERYCFLFNDLFVCCKEKKKGMVLEVEFKEPLGTLKVEDMDDSSEFRYLFKLTSSANEYVFSTSDKHHWISLIAQYISLLKTEGAEAPHNDVEESSRESLINRIIKWSKMDDAEEVLAQVCELAAILERYKTMNVPHTGPATSSQYQ